MEPFQKPGLEMVLIPRICNYMDFTDLKSFRSVSKKWCKLVSELKVFNVNRRTVLNASVKTFDKMPTLQWTNVKLIQYIENGRGRFMKEIWPKMGETVTELNFTKVQINCDEMCRLLNYAPALETVIFNEVIFNKGLEQPVGDGTTIRIYCTHNTPNMQNQEYEKFTRTLVPTPSIKKLKIQNQPGFPICLMENLITRSHGTLIDLSIRESPIPPKRGQEVTTVYQPNMNYLRPQILPLMKGSANSLKRLEFYNNFGFQMFQYLMDRVEFNEFKITELVFANFIRNVRIPAGLIHEENEMVDPEREAMLGLVAHLSPSHVESLILNVPYEHTGQQMVTNMLAALPNLRKLYIGFLNCVRHFIRIEIPDRCQLSEILIYTNTRTFNQTSFCQPVYFWPAFLNTLHLEKLNSLSIATNLTITHDANLPQQFKRYIDTRNFRNLTKLCFWKGQNVPDELLQSIIIRIPHLEELTICNSTKITESGVTGLAEETCESIARSYSTGRPFPTNIVEIGVTGRCLRELKYLQRLNLSGCRNITDACLDFAFKFPNLKELNLHQCVNVSDHGLARLGKNTPSLEKLILPHSSLISPQGISALITACRLLKTIILASVGSTSFNHSQFPPPSNPNFYDIVKVKKEKDEMIFKDFIE